MTRSLTFGALYRKIKSIIFYPVLKAHHYEPYRPVIYFPLIFLTLFGPLIYKIVTADSDGKEYRYQEAIAKVYDKNKICIKSTKLPDVCWIYKQLLLDAVEMTYMSKD